MKKLALVAVILLLVASVAHAQCETLTFISESLPLFVVGQPANFQLEVCCGTEPYSFEIVDGTLPAGLHMNSQGKFRGVPREAVNVTILVKLTDANGCTLHQAFNLFSE